MTTRRMASTRISFITLMAGGALLALTGCPVPSHYVLAGDASSDLVQHDVVTTDVPGADATGNDALDIGTVDTGMVDTNAGDAGTDASADAGDGSTWPPSAQSIAVVCALINSCTNVFTSGNMLTACIDSGLSGVFSARNGGTPFFSEASQVQRLYACAATSFDCQSLADCFSGGHPASLCTDADGSALQSVCVGDDLVNCQFGAPPVTVNCAEWGMQCHPINSRQAVCTNGIPCPGGFSMVPQCDGDNWIGCERTSLLEQSVACSKVLPGTTCRMVSTNDAEPRATCVPNGVACTQANPHCEGNILVECDRGTNTEIRTDCTVLFASTCETQGATAQCKLGTDCTTATADTCPSGSTIRTCLNGSYFNINCGALGLQYCQTTTTDPTRCY